MKLKNNFDTLVLRVSVVYYQNNINIMSVTTTHHYKQIMSLYFHITFYLSISIHEINSFTKMLQLHNSFTKYFILKYTPKKLDFDWHCFTTPYVKLKASDESKLQFYHQKKIMFVKCYVLSCKSFCLVSLKL